MKQVPFFTLLFILPVLLFAQQQDTGVVKNDSLRRDSVTLQPVDSLSARRDSVKKQDSIIPRAAAYDTMFHRLLKDNLFLNFSGKPVAMVNKVRKERSQQDVFFYLIAAIAALLAFFRFFYTRYFNNLFRVFFNASLRQSQLTDQLLQAKLPSLFFNIVFVFIGGVYAYLLLRYYKWVSDEEMWKILLYSTLSLALIYFIKFLSLKFTGWLTGFKQVTNTYIFIIFLINKILGILLIPFTIIIAFSIPELTTAAVIISLLLIGLMFLLRFFRSYGLLQHQLKISRFHFFMYVAGIEVIPVLLIYKGLVLLLSKNL